MDELTISVTIADRPYRLTIKRNEEETLRKAASEINKNLKHYSDSFAYNDKQDLLAMVALEKTTNALMNKSELKDIDNNIAVKLTEIDKLLTDSLKD